MKNAVSSVNAKSNVNIKVINRDGKLIRNSSIHNKATINLVEGILRFLRSEFTPSYYNDSEDSFVPSDARSYIPAEVRFGHVGVIMKDRNTDKPRLVKIDEGQLKKPTFEEYRLQEEIAANRTRFAMTRIKFETAELVSFSDVNNSLALKLHAYIPPGQLVYLKDTPVMVNGYLSGGKFYEDSAHTIIIDPSAQRLYKNLATSPETIYKWVPSGSSGYYNKIDPSTPAGQTELENFGKFYFTDDNVKDSSDPREGQGWVYYRGQESDSSDENKGYEAIFTEIGLYSAEGVLLARVVFDGTLSVDEYSNVTFDDPSNENNPVIQSEDSSIIIEWTIGITSVGQNDEILTGSDLRGFGITQNMTVEEIDELVETEVGGYTVGILEQLKLLSNKYKELTGHVFEVSDEYVSTLEELLGRNS